MSSLVAFVDKHRVRLVISRRNGVWEAYLSGVEVGGKLCPDGEGATPDEAISSLSAALDGKMIMARAKPFGVFSAAEVAP